MSFKFINKILIFIFLLFIFSCQNNIISSDKNKDEHNLKNESNIESIDKVDLSFQKKNNLNVLDYYSSHKVSHNFFVDKLKRIKICIKLKVANFKLLKNKKINNKHK